MNSIKRGLKVWFTVFLIMFSFGIGDAIAGSPERQAVRQACEADYRTFCIGVQPGGGRIIACLHQNFDKLSTGSRTLYRKPRQRDKPLHGRSEVML